MGLNYTFFEKNVKINQFVIENDPLDIGFQLENSLIRKSVLNYVFDEKNPAGAKE